MSSLPQMYSSSQRLSITPFHSNRSKSPFDLNSKLSKDQDKEEEKVMDDIIDTHSIIDHDDTEILFEGKDDSEHDDDEKGLDEIRMHETIFTKKFKHWLCDNVKLAQYLIKFELRQSNDIRAIKYMDDTDLMNIGIENKFHRKIILEAIDIYKKLQQDFDELLDKHKVLRSFRGILKKKGILTRLDLANIPNKKELQTILNLSDDDDKVSEIWYIIHPSQSQLHVEMNELQIQIKQTVAMMEESLQSIQKMQNKIRMSKQNSFTRQLQQMQDSMVNDYYLICRNHRDILQRTDNSESGDRNYDISATPSQILKTQRDKPRISYPSQNEEHTHLSARNSTDNTTRSNSEYFNYSHPSNRSDTNKQMIQSIDDKNENNQDHD